MQTDAKERVYAGFFVRLTAFLVDMLIVNTALLFIRIPMGILSMSSPNNILTRQFIFQYSIVNIVCYLLTVTYFVLMTYHTGSTLGKKLFQIRVVSMQDRDMTFFEVLYRESIGRYLAGVIMKLGYILILAQKEHRGAHDLLSDTCVIYYHEKKVYVHTQMNYRNMAPKPGYIVPPQNQKAQSNYDMPPQHEEAKSNYSYGMPPQHEETQSNYSYGMPPQHEETQSNYSYGMPQDSTNTQPGFVRPPQSAGSSLESTESENMLQEQSTEVQNGDDNFEVH